MIVYSSINSMTFFGAVDYHQVDEKHKSMYTGIWKFRSEHYYVLYTYRKGGTL